MKRFLLTALLASLATLAARADLMWYEPFIYTNGPIIVNGTNLDGSTNWFRHSGTASPSDSLVSGRKLQVSYTGSPSGRQDDVHRNFPAAYTGSKVDVFASFTLNCTTAPTNATAYFAHFYEASTIFNARVFALQGTNAGTYRLGISGAGTASSQVFPVDLATGVDYQVVVEWDPVNLFSGILWVNPTNSGDVSVTSNDTVASPLAGLGFAFRQASSFGQAFFVVSNLATATTFDEAATNVWSTSPIPPIIIASPKSATNFVGNAITLSGMAAGQGLGSMTYTWLKNGNPLSNPNGNTNAFIISSGAVSDTGNYRLVATTPYGLSATSSVAFLWVTNPPVPPTMVMNASNTTVYFGQTATLTALATGSPTITYQWYYGGNQISGATDPVLQIPNVQTTNGTTGTYRCDAINPYGTTPGANAVLSAIPVPLTNIAYLRTLVDPTYFLITNTTALWSVNGTVTSFNPMTGSPNSSYTIQDATGGLTVFVPTGAAFLPDAGANVNVIGTLSSFNGLIELNVNLNDPAQGVLTNSLGNLQPPGVVLPFSFTNGVAVGGVGNAFRQYGGSVVAFTNVYFPAGFTNGTFAAGSTYLMTNTAGEGMKLFLNAATTNLNGSTIPQHAWLVRGPLGYYLGNTVTDRSSGYEFDPTRIDDIISADPAPVTVTNTPVNSRQVLTWTAQPFMSYTVRVATNVAGPYTVLASGLTFNTTAGQYTDTNTLPATRFYQIASP